MSDDPHTTPGGLQDDGHTTFLLRWRGRQEGPYTEAVLETKLAANQIGLLHEILHNGQWVTLREFYAERDALARAEREAREEESRLAREEADRQSRDREEQRQTQILAEERRKNDLMQASISERQRTEPASQIHPAIVKPHRAGTILALGLIGLLVCGPLCIAAWVMGDSDIREMDAGLMDKSGRDTTSTGRTLGVLGSIIWLVIIIFFVVLQS
jgi:hypothetical protein